MAGTVIKNNENIVPFMGERLNFIKGQDPLGLQNSSEATFTMLLPGLNNGTGRIRYYSFYCWLFDEYSKNIRSTNPDHQKSFIRRAEYIIALASNYFEGDAGNITGSLYANRQIKNDPNFKHDLQKGTYNPDGSTTDTYFKNSFGGFGQFYSSSLKDIGLISDRESNGGVYVRTSSNNTNFISGEKLASAFNDSISAETKNLFFSCLNDGWISEEELQKLLPDFQLTQIPFGSREQELLLDLLLNKDFPQLIEEEPAEFRKTTIARVLRYSQTNSINDRDFVYDCYNEKGKINSEIDPTYMGWYYYQFNEFWHFANTSILNGTLSYLEVDAGPNWAPLKELLESICNSVVEYFITNNYISEKNDIVDNLLLNLKGNEYEYLKACQIHEPISKIANGFLLFFSQYINQQIEFVILKNYMQVHNLGKDGDGVDYFRTEFKVKKQQSIDKYIFEYIYKHIINRHQYVALRKISGGTLTTQKFILEEQNIRYLGNFEAGYTGPRLVNLISFMKNLYLINNEGQLTEKGVDLLQSLENGLN